MSSTYQTRRAIPPVVKADLTDKTVMVIGANTGLGFEAAKHFASMNPSRLILGCRDASKGQAALEKVQYDRAELWIIDLSTFASVIRFADKALKELDRLDILVENAGMMRDSYELTNDGWQSMLQVNNLSPELLALLLLPKMKDTTKNFPSAGSPRIVVVSSDVSFRTEFKEELIYSSENIWRTLSSPWHWSSGAGDRRYPNAMIHHYYEVKLLNIFFVRALQNHLIGSSILVNAVHPGLCFSGLYRAFTGDRAVALKKTMDKNAYTVEEGSRSIIYGAVGGSECEDTLRGAYVHMSEVKEPSDFVQNELGKKAQIKIWDDMVEILKAVDSRVEQHLGIFQEAH